MMLAVIPFAEVVETAQGPQSFAFCDFTTGQCVTL